MSSKPDAMNPDEERDLRTQALRLAIDAIVKQGRPVESKLITETAAEFERYLKGNSQ